MGEQLSLLDKPIRIQFLNRLDDTTVKPAPPFLEQAAVSDLVGERVFEGVFELGEKTRLIEKLAGLEAARGRGAIPLRINPLWLEAKQMAHPCQ